MDLAEFGRLSIQERYAFLQRDPQGYEWLMEQEALAHQREFLETGKRTTLPFGPLAGPPAERLDRSGWRSVYDIELERRTAIVAEEVRHAQAEPLLIRLERIGKVTHAQLVDEPFAASGRGSSLAISRLLAKVRRRYPGRAWSCPEAGVGGVL